MSDHFTSSTVFCEVGKFPEEFVHFLAGIPVTEFFLVFVFLTTLPTHVPFANASSEKEQVKSVLSVVCEVFADGVRQSISQCDIVVARDAVS